MTTGYDGATQRMARFIRETTYEGLPPSTIQATKRAILDTVASSLSGASTEVGRILRSYLAQQGGREEATLLGLPEKASAEGAALFNGASARVLELDDTHTPSGMHPGSVVVSASLAMAEAVGASGQQVVTAVALGYEVALRTAMAVMPAMAKRGFHPTGVCGALGAAAAAGKLLELDQEGYVNLLGTAATSAGGLFQFESEGGDTFMSSTLNAGRGASAGVASARLTALGFKGPRQALEGDRAFARAFADGLDEDARFSGLGSTFLVEDLDYTVYPCCRHTRSAVEAVLDLLRDSTLTLDDVERVEVQTYLAATADSCRRVEVRDPYDALFSIPYGVAAAVLRGRVSQEEFTPTSILDPQIRGVMRRVTVKPDLELNQRYPARSPARVVVHTRQGRTVERLVEYSKGMRGNPLTPSEHRQKFLDQALAAGVSQEHAAQAADLLLEMEEQPSVDQAMALLRLQLPS